MSGIGGGRWRRWVAAALIVAGLEAVSAAAWPSSAAAADQIPTATSFPGVPAVGAVFPDGVASPHTCTGSVIRGAGPDVVLTAAHCLSGTGQGVVFAPGYHDGAAPYGLWTVSAVYADPRWVSAQDPQHDYAFLVLEPRRRAGHTTHLHDLVAGYLLGTAPDPGREVSVIAYAQGLNDRPIICTTATYRFSGYPAFDCHGFVLGTSGAPWLTWTSGSFTVRGTIGGLHQGGCYEYTSYSSAFDRDTLATYQRAQRGTAPDDLPVPGGDGC
ncbi:MAG TPA: trypsin-like peptidase domain-containing protein [Kineosporiaceae bacterium]|nr:trypsin-like peptidase domain-containing protein [Kineosporiaceae bacterium]